MEPKLMLSRREFLVLAGGAVSAVTLGACASQIPTTVATPPATQFIPAGVEFASSDVVTIEAGGFEMVLVEPGYFQMGSVSGRSAERPVHTINITRPFYISKYEVTFDQYDEFHEDARKDTPKLDDSGWGRGNRPATNIVWPDTIAYCNWLSEREELDLCYSGREKATQCDFRASGYRLPTEAEWEYAARGGHKSQGFIYAGSDNVDDVGWHVDNSNGQTQPVGQKQPNELGLYDMSGNVWEFCWDWYDRDYYESSPTDDPTGSGFPAGPFDRNKIRRGGSWHEGVNSLSVTYRSQNGWRFVANTNGFRIVRTA